MYIYIHVYIYADAYLYIEYYIIYLCIMHCTYMYQTHAMYPYNHPFMYCISIRAI